MSSFENKCKFMSGEYLRHVIRRATTDYANGMITDLLSSRLENKTLTPEQFVLESHRTISDIRMKINSDTWEFLKDTPYIYKIDVEDMYHITKYNKCGDKFVSKVIEKGLERHSKTHKEFVDLL